MSTTTANDPLAAGRNAGDAAQYPAAMDTMVPRLVAGLKPLLLLIGVAAAVAAGVSVVLWTRGATYGLLYANLPTEDQAAVTQALDAAGIPNKLSTDGGGILVPQERLGEARLKLAGQGLPENDGGFAILTKDPGLGVSQFVEDARYQHAMESELAHTISSLRPVEGARVHLAAPRQSAFVRDHHQASASVFVQLKPGRRLETEQVRAIVNLVASSVPELDSRQVTVVDQQGHLLNSPDVSDDPASRTDQQLREVQSIEDDYQQRVESILSPILGPGRVHAQVVAQVDTSTTEQAREQYRPGSQIVRSEQESEQVSRDGTGSQGVPGALSNQPPAAGQAQPPAANKAPAPPAAPANGAPPAAAAPQGAPTQATVDAAASSGPDNLSKQSTRNYELDRTVDYTRQPAGRIKRLTVAVLVDDVHSIDKGKETHHPLSGAQIDHMTELVKEAVGFDQSRGDSVSVVNASFQEDPPLDNSVDQPAVWETPMFQNLAKLGAAVIVLLVLSLSVLRPLVRGLINPPKPAARRSAPAADVMPDNVRITPGAQAALGGKPSAADAQKEQAKAETEAYEDQIQTARALVNQDPKLVAHVVHSWVSDNE